MKKNKNNSKNRKVIYYSDELNDDFAGTNIKTKKVGKNFKFIHKSPIWKFFSFLFYNCIAMPVVSFYCRIMKRVKFVNKKAIREARKHTKKGVFLFGNHTGIVDAYTPNIISFPYKNKILTSPDAVSIKGMKNIVQMLGAIPVPQEISALRKFTEAIEYYNKKKCNITIYPEAHIWPYYTGVRPFKDSSFSYAVSTNSPVVAFFTAYSKPSGLYKNIRKTNVTVYVSDPFYPDQSKPRKEAQKEIRDKVYEFMKDCSEKYSTYSYIEYKHISEKPENFEATGIENVIDDKDFE